MAKSDYSVRIHRAQDTGLTSRMAEISLCSSDTIGISRTGYRLLNESALLGNSRLDIIGPCGYIILSVEIRWIN